MTTDTTKAALADLPQLPEAKHRGPGSTGTYFDSYTAEQMREYARAALLRANAAVVPPTVYVLDNQTFSAIYEAKEDAQSFASMAGTACGLMVREVRIVPASSRGVAAAPSAPVLAEPQKGGQQ